jgi:hypothetical protein
MKILIPLFCLISAVAYAQPIVRNEFATNNTPTARAIVTNVVNAAVATKANTNAPPLFDATLHGNTAIGLSQYSIRYDSAGSGLFYSGDGAYVIWMHNDDGSLSLGFDGSIITNLATSVYFKNITSNGTPVNAIGQTADGRLYKIAIGAGVTGMANPATADFDLNEYALLNGGAGNFASVNISGALNMTGLATSMAVVTDGSQNVTTHASVSATEIGHLDGVTGGIQTNIEARVSYGGTPGVISNLNAVVFAEHSPAITTSNLFLSFDTNLHTCIGLTNLVLTNWQERATGSDDMNLFVHNTTAVTMGIVWPNQGAQHGYYFATNANNDARAVTSIPSGERWKISVNRVTTNIMATALKWF